MITIILLIDLECDASKGNTQLEKVLEIRVNYCST